MRRYYSYIAIPLLILTIFLSVFTPVSVFAQGQGGICDIGLINGMCNLLGTIIYTLPVTLSSWILWAGGSFLNFILKYTVVDMRENIDAITGINIAWRTIRDLANISFIFILLYAAINTILEREKDWQRVVRSIIIAAVLINFSLFFTKLLIDASNIVALTFYQQMVPNGDTAVGLSNYYLQPLGLSSFWSPGTAEEIIRGYSFGTLIVMSIGSSIFFLITAFTFFATAVMFLIRYVNFIFLLILSPIAVLGSVFSSGELTKNINKWWSTLTSQLMFAPVFMIMTWAVITIINSPGFSATVGTSGTTATLGAFSGMFKGELSSFGLVMNFLIVIALAIGTLTVSKSVAAQGGTATQKLVGGVLGFGTGAAAGTLSTASRLTLGSLGKKLADNTKLQAKEDTSMAARLALRASRGASKASFDIRNSAPAKVMGTVGKATGMGSLESYGLVTGTPSKGSYVDMQKRYKEFMAKPGSDTYKARKESSDIARSKLAIQEGDETRVQSELVKMKAARVESLGTSTLKKDTVAQNLSGQQFDTVMKSDKIGDDDKKAIQNARFQKISNAISANNISTVSKEIKSLSKEDFDHMDSTLITQPSFATELSDDQVKKIMENPRFSQVQKESLQEARKQPIVDALKNGNTQLVRDIVRRAKTGKDITRLMKITTGNSPALLHEEVLPTLKKGVLKKLVPELSGEEIDLIRNTFKDKKQSILIAKPNPPYTDDEQSILNTVAWLEDRDGLDNFSS